MHVRNDFADKFYAVDDFRFVSFRRTAAGKFFLEVKDFRLKLFLFFQQVADTRLQIVRIGLEHRANLVQFVFYRVDIFFRAFAGNAFNPANACRNRGFGHNVEIADFSRIANVCTAAKFARINRAVFFHRYHTHLIAVFFTEQSHRAGLNRVFLRHNHRIDVIILPDSRIDHIFGLLNFFSRNLLRVRDVKTHSVRRNQRAFLRNVFAQNRP